MDFRPRPPDAGTLATAGSDDGAVSATNHAYAPNTTMMASCTWPFAVSSICSARRRTVARGGRATIVGSRRGPTVREWTPRRPSNATGAPPPPPTHPPTVSFPGTMACKSQCHWQPHAPAHLTDRVGYEVVHEQRALHSKHVQRVAREFHVADRGRELVRQECLAKQGVGDHTADKRVARGRREAHERHVEVLRRKAVGKRARGANSTTQTHTHEAPHARTTKTASESAKRAKEPARTSRHVLSGPSGSGRGAGKPAPPSVLPVRLGSTRDCGS